MYCNPFNYIILHSICYYPIACMVNASSASPIENLCPSIVQIDTPHLSDPALANVGIYDEHLPLEFTLH